MEIDQQFAEYINTAGRPIPGQSLTNDPQNPQPFETSPEFTELRDALEYIFVALTEEETYVQVMQEIGNGLPIMDFVQVFLFEGFNNGKWNPDLMLLLAEPMTYMIMALAERIDIDYIIYRGEELEDEAEEQVLGVKGSEEVIEKIKQARGVPAGALPEEITSAIEEMPVDSLMAKPPEEEAEEAPASLMAQQ